MVSVCVSLITLIDFVDKVGLPRRIRKVVKIGLCRVGAQSKKPRTVRKQVWLGPCMVRALTEDRNRLGRK